MPFDAENLPALSEDCVPQPILGTAALAGRAYAAADPAAALSEAPVACLYDESIVQQLCFRKAEGMAVQARALAQNVLYRIRHPRPASAPLRLLALCAPGDLMVNTPLDFITNELDVRLDLLFLLPDQLLPAVLPDHDVAFCAVSEAAPPLLHHLIHLCARWPRPVLNDPRHLPLLARDTLSRALADAPGTCSPRAIAATRNMLHRHLQGVQPLPPLGAVDSAFPCLIRPLHAHAGTGLSLLNGDADLDAYLRLSLTDRFYLTAFQDYAGPDGLYRKLRIAFIEGRPHLCHMAVSRHWMVHYLNAGMTDSAAKRDMEAEAMDTFDIGFARRHAVAFDVLNRRLGFDYYSIDCAETPDGRLLVFEADTAAIIHMMDPPEVFPYKRPQMRRVFDAFGAMLRHGATRGINGTMVPRTGAIVPA